MFISTNFSYDGISNKDMGVILVSSSSGLKEKGFGMPRNTIKEKVKGRKKPYFFGFEEQPITFQIEIMKANGTAWTLQERMNICHWLFKNDYKDFISEDNIDILYKCTAVGEPKFYVSRSGVGYAQIEFECDAPHAWSQLSIQEFDLSSINDPTIIQIQNISNIDDYYYPEIQFKLVGNETNFKMVNLNDGGREFSFTDLNIGETVYINNDNKNIKSDSGNYRLPVNKQFFRLVYGTNNVQVFNKCNLLIRCQFPIMI